MEAIARLVDAVGDLRRVRPRVLVGIDGPDAAGKTTMADQLAQRLSGLVVRASADDFQHPRAVRRRRGSLSPDGYYLDAFDHATLADKLLTPFGNGASTVMTAHFDYDEDEPAEVSIDVPPCAVLVVDGVFLQRETIRSFWSLIVYLTVSPEVAFRRGVDRDAGRLGTSEELELRYAERYLPAQALYRADVDPERNADVVIDNTDPSSAVIIRGLR